MKLEIEDEFADKITYQSLFDTRNGLIDYYHDEDRKSTRLNSSHT